MGWMSFWKSTFQAREADCGASCDRATIRRAPTQSPKSARPLKSGFDTRSPLIDTHLNRKTAPLGLGAGQTLSYRKPHCQRVSSANLEVLVSEDHFSTAEACERRPRLSVVPWWRSFNRTHVPGMGSRCASCSFSVNRESQQDVTADCAISGVQKKHAVSQRGSR